MSANEQVISKDNVSRLALRDVYRTRMVSQAAPVSGPFSVLTLHGGEPVKCQDGWVVIDASGYPFPVATSEFVQIYSEDVTAFLSSVPEGLLRAELARLERQVVGASPIDLDA